MLKISNVSAALFIFCALCTVPCLGSDIFTEATLTVNPPGSAALAGPPLKLSNDVYFEPLDSLFSAEVDAWEELDSLVQWNRDGRLPTKIGFVRSLNTSRFVSLSQELLEKHADLHAGGRYRHLGDHVIWNGWIRVENAHSLRLHLADVDLPTDTQLWVYGDHGDWMAFDRTLSGPDGDLWTPSVSGSAIYLEMDIRKSHFDLGEEYSFVVDSVSQSFPLEELGFPDAILTDLTAADHTDCLADAACFSDSTLPDISLYKDAVAHLQYIKSGSSFICTGALVNDKNVAGFIPYMLTANHCISTQAVASTLESYFDYIASRCSGPPPSLFSLPRVAGSSLLVTRASTDSTFLRLNNNPSGLTGYLGWTTGNLTSGTNLYRISHPFPSGTPRPFQQLFSRSVVHSVPGCNGLPSSNFAYSRPTLGGVFGGSSGSPTVDANLQIRGQLFGQCGPVPSEGCNYSNSQVDGRFSVFFSQISQYLDPSQGNAPCEPSSTVLCIDSQQGDRRFAVRLHFDSALGGGVEGDANVRSLSSLGISKGGILSFTDTSNPEVLVKILNGCSITNHFWVFYAATTTLGFELTVVDTKTGASRRYVNPDNHPATTITDTQAFATCP